MHAHFTSYRDQLNAVLANKQLRAAYLGRLLVMVTENGPSLHIDDADSELERGGCTLTSSFHADDVEVVPPPAGPS